MLRLAVALSIIIASAPRATFTIDLDGDGDADLRDFAEFQLAFTGPEISPTHLPADLNRDERVDLSDYRLFLGESEDTEDAPRTQPDNDAQRFVRTLLWLLLLLLLHVSFENAKRDQA